MKREAILVKCTILHLLFISACGAVVVQDGSDRVKRVDEFSEVFFKFWECFLSSAKFE